MLRIEFDEQGRFAILEPEGELSESDFQMAARTIDPYIEKFGELNGIVIHVEHFPGWDSFSSLVNSISSLVDLDSLLATLGVLSLEPVERE